MSDMAPRPNPSPIPGVKPNAITENMSALNPADMAMKAQAGQITKDMSIRQWFENTLGVSVDSPAAQLPSILKTHIQNRNGAGKVQSIAENASQRPPMAPPQAPPAGGAPQGAPQQGGGLEALMSQLKGGA